MKEKVTLKIQGTEIREFEMYLYERENAEATIRKYITDLKCFFRFLEEIRKWTSRVFFLIKNSFSSIMR